MGLILEARGSQHTTHYLLGLPRVKEEVCAGFPRRRSRLVEEARLVCSLLGVKGASTYCYQKNVRVMTQQIESSTETKSRPCPFIGVERRS